MIQEKKLSQNTNTTQEWIKVLCDLARRSIDPAKTERIKQRHAAIFRWEDADSIPMMFSRNVPELDQLDLPEYNWNEQFHDPAKSFIPQMIALIRAAASGSDYLPSLRADTGVVNAPSIFGSVIDIPPHTKPVVKDYPSKETLAAFEVPGDIRGLGIIPQVIEHTEHHLQVLKEEGLEEIIELHHCDTQGPFDIAEQARGVNLLTDVYEDPDFVHHLMRQCTRAYIALNDLHKELTGGDRQRGNASGFFMDPGGVRMCDDSGIVVSPDTFAEFIQPYQIEAFAPFGAGWLHYCGGVPEGGRSEGLHLHDLYLANPYIRGLNFTTGQDLSAEIRKITAAKVNYIGGVPRKEEETLAAYFHRVLSLCPGRKGMFFRPELRPGEEDRAMEEWRRAQDDCFGNV